MKYFKKYKSSIIIVTLLLMIIMVFSILFNSINLTKVKSINEDAIKYKTGRCIAFYPNSKNGKETVKELCKEYKGKEKIVYDYSLIPYGDYYLVSYDKDHHYYVDKNYEDIKVEEISENGKKIIGDYLRYTIKVQQNDRYYDSEFLASTTYDKLDFDNITYSINGANLECEMPDFELTVEVPLKYMQEEISMNFGYKNELYQKPVYIDDNHPAICLTFDDGPEFWWPSGETSTEEIVDTLYLYDANATFFLIGDNLEERDNWSNYQVYSFFKRSIANGNEYGSNTQHQNDFLTDYNSAEDIRNAINKPAETFYNLLGYKMKLYRPVAGAFNDKVLEAQTLTAVLWNIDSEDWYSGDANVIFNKISKYADKNELETGDIIVLHDIYDATSEAMTKLIPYLIDKGYQIVTVSDMLSYIGVDSSAISYFYSPIYYE